LTDEYKKRCGNCINFDDGICDFNGYRVEPDDNPRCDGRGWKRGTLLQEDFMRKSEKKLDIARK
jgi:hypothetical protein